MKTMLELMRGFTIRLRMLGAIGVVLSLFGLIGVVGMAGVAKIKSLNADFMAHSIHEIESVSSVRQHLALVRLHEKQMVIDYEDGVAVLKHREAWQAEIEATKKAFGALLSGEEDGDNALARDSIAKLESYRERSAPVLLNVQNGGYDNASIADRMLSKAKEEVSVAEANLEKIATVVTGEAQQTQEEFVATMHIVMLAFGATLVVVVLIVAPLTLLNSYSITRPIAYAARVAESISNGDLTSHIRTEGRDEATALLHALDHMQLSLRKLVAQVHESSQSIQNSSGEVASGNTDLSQRTEQAASALQQTASSMSQLTGTVNQTADSARTASQLASSASEVAARGGSVVAQVVSTMGQINSSSHRIADIIGTIDGIAFQTNILALNAAVEAARAGEQGRGFAVVASEVRSLAQRSAAAAREIKTLIGASVERVEAGTKLVTDAGSTMTEIVASVQRVSDIIGDISAAAAEQSSGIGQVNGAVNDLDRMTQQNAALVEESAAAAESLREQATRLVGLVGNFRLTEGEATNALPAAPAHSARPRPLAAKTHLAPAARATPRHTPTAPVRPATPPNPTAPAHGSPRTAGNNETQNSVQAEAAWETF
jgi:methyl-accepting chemotaxis protein